MNYVDISLCAVAQYFSHTTFGLVACTCVQFSVPKQPHSYTVIIRMFFKSTNQNALPGFRVVTSRDIISGYFVQMSLFRSVQLSMRACEGNFRSVRPEEDVSNSGY